jgi:hypothetical protein
MVCQQTEPHELRMGLKDSFAIVRTMYTQIASAGAGEADGKFCHAGGRGAETKVAHAITETGEQDLP